MFNVILWRLDADNGMTVECGLVTLDDGMCRLRVVKNGLAFMEHDYAERREAIAASIKIYARLKENGFHGTPHPC